MKQLTADVAPCGIRHLHLEALPAGLAVDADERALLLVVWMAGRPLGARVLLAAELPLPASALPAMAADIAADGLIGSETHAATPVAPQASVSVVVCTRSRPADLRRCLGSLSRCEPPASEIIVVDNAPAGDETARVVAEFPTATYVHEPVPGLSHARNRGLVAASGQLIAFTDDDVEVPANWIGASIAPFSDAAVACVTGTVLPADLSNDAACVFEFEMGGLGKAFVPRRYRQATLDRGLLRAPEVWTIGAGANMIVRRSAFTVVGGFDPRLGAGTSGCSEDSEFWFRLLRAGLECVYEPGSVVLHRHRPDWNALSRQLRAYSRGHVTALFVQYAQDHHPSHLVRVAGVLPWHYAKLAARAVFRGESLQLRAVGYQVLGLLEGILHAPYWLTRDGYPTITGPARPV